MVKWEIKIYSKDGNVNTAVIVAVGSPDVTDNMVA
jgi:hypothetical protein